MTDIQLVDTGKDMNVYRDACCVKDKEEDVCGCSCVSQCGADSKTKVGEDGMGNLNDWVGKCCAVCLVEEGLELMLQ